MQKFLRTLILTALLCVPWITQAQVSLPYSYGFENNDLSTDGWVLYGATSSSTGITSSAAQTGSYGFRFEYSEQSAYLMSPVFTGTSNGLNVMFSYKEYSSSYGDEEFQVGYTTDETVTDPSQFTYGSTVTASTSWQDYENSFPAGTKRIAIKYIYNDAFYLYLDDFTFEAPSACAKPTSVSVTGATASTISIEWVPVGSETSWKVYLDDAYVATVNNTEYTFDNLVANNDYTIGVSAVCGSDESTQKTITIHLGYCVPAPTSVDGSGITNVTFGIGTVVNDNITMSGAPYYYDHSAQIGYAYPGATVNMTIEYATNYTYYTWVWIDWNNDFTFSDDERIQAPSTISSGTLVFPFDIPTTVTPGDYRMRIQGKDGSSNNPCYASSWSYLIDYTLHITEPPSCLPVSDLQAEPTTDGAVLTWTAANGETAWQVTVGDNTYNVSGNPTYTITGLNALTTYTASVVADCGSNGTALPVAVTFNTLGTGNTCEVNLTCSGYNFSYGYAQIDAYQNGVLVGSASSTGTIEVYSAYPVEFRYAPTNTWYSGTVVITDAAGEEVFNGSTGYSATVLTTVDVPCPSCYKPTSLTVSDETVEGATLTWERDTRNADGETYTVYNVTDDEEYATGVTGNSITLTGLNDNTTYEFTVTANCSATDNSADLSVTFTTVANCPAPTAVAVVENSVAPHAASISWNGDAAQYNVRYQVYNSVFEGFEEGSVPEGWTANITSSSSGVSSDAAHSSSYGFKFNYTESNGSLVSPLLSNTDNGVAVSFYYKEYSNTYGDEQFQVGYTTSETVTDPSEFTYGSIITASLNWQLYENTFPAGTKRFAIKYIYNDALYLYIDDIDINVVNDTWETDIATTTTYSIDELDAETKYLFQAQSICGGNVSDWSAPVYFTTLPSCFSISNVQASDVAARTATITWDANDNNDASVTYNVTATPTAGGSAIEVTGITATTYTFTGTNALEPETQYTISVATNCSGDLAGAVSVTITTLEACPTPTNVAMDGEFVPEDGGTYSATLTWDGNDGSTYTVTATPGEGDDIVVNNVSETTTTLSGLVLGETYAVTVVADCGSEGTSNASVVYDLKVNYCTPTNTNTDGSGITNVAFGMGEEVVDNATAKTQYGDFSAMVGSIPASLDCEVTISYSTGSYPYGTIIWVDWNNNLAFEDSEIMYAKKAASGSGDLVATFNIPATTPVGNYRMRIAGADSYYDSYVTTLDEDDDLDAAAGANPCMSGGTWGTTHDYTLHVLDVPSCMPVTNVVASNVTTTGATLTWEDTENEATYTIYNMEDNSQVATGLTALTYDLTGLSSNTSYTFGVEANCLGANGTKVTVSFNTPQTPAEIPYATGFEASDDNDQWTVVNGFNGWYVGEAATEEGNSLYISNNGTDYTYTNSTATVSYAYRVVDFADAGWYRFAYDWRCKAESNKWDYLYAWLAPATTEFTAGTLPTGMGTSSMSGTYCPEGWIDLTQGAKDASDEWNSENQGFELATAGQYKLVLMWRNDNSGGSGVPAAVDNIVLESKSAFEPTDLTAENITATSATLTWTRDELNEGNETYTIYNGTDEVATDIDADNYTVEITANTDYTFSVVAVNGGQTSNADAVSLRVNEYPTEPGKMVKLTYSYSWSGTDNPSVKFYYGMGDNRSDEAAESYTTTYRYNQTFTNSTSFDWSVDGPVTVVFLNHNANAIGFSSENVTYNCPAVVTNTDPVVVDNATESYTWTTVEGHEYDFGPVSGTELDEVVEPFTGSYSDTVLNVAQCDSIYRHLDLTIYPTYEVSISDEFCEGTTYTVNSENVAIATGDESFEYTASAVEDVHMTAAGGADVLVHVSLQMNPAPAAQINNRTTNTISNHCDGFPLLLNARSNMEGVTFQWDDNSTDATRTVNPTVAAENEYTLIAIDPATGCQSLEPATLTVTATAVPELLLTHDALNNEICLGESVTFTVSNNNDVEATYRWSNGQTGTSITVTPTERTGYSVTATSTNAGCEVTVGDTIDVNPLPVVTLQTSVNALCSGDQLTLSASETEGYTYKWNTGAETAETNVNPTVTGNYSVTVTDQKGCVDSFTTANVTVYPVYDLEDEQSVCFTQNPYTWKAGQQTAMDITENGSYEYTFQSVNGCDSTVHLTFTFEEMSVYNSYREICQGTDVTWGTETYTNIQESTTLTYTLNAGDTDPDNNILDCPAQYNLVLTVNPVKASSFDLVVCDTYTWNLNGETYTESGDYAETLQTTKGCDSVVTMNLTVNYQNTGVDVQTACDQFVWNLNGVRYTESNNTATYTLTGANVDGCDSVVTLDLTVNYKSYYEEFIRECDHTTYTWRDGVEYSMSVDPEDNITYTLEESNAAGCDSIAILSLTMNYVLDTLNWTSVTACDNYYIDTVACDGATGRRYIAESGDYLIRTRNAETGRDRISRIHLTIVNSDHQTVPVTACVPYTWQVTDNIVIEDINPVANDTIISQEVENEYGCSVVMVLRLHALRPTEKTTQVTLCQNDSWTDGNDVEYLAADYELGENEPIMWNQTVNEAGCDSTDYVVFTVNPVYNVEGTLTYCESEFTDGALTYTNPNNADESIELTIAAEGLDQQVYTNTVVAEWTTNAGCDSIVTITYTVNPTLYEDITVQNCYEYTWNGQTFNTLGEVEATYEGTSVQYGCDSVATLHLTLTDTVEGTVTIQACGEYEYNGVIYRESMTFREISTVKATSGCDSITNYVYVLTPRVMKDVYIVANAPYTWVNGVEYSQSVEGIYYDATEPDGCDSILMLHLTMQEPIVICEGELPYTTTYGVTLTDATASLYNETVEDVEYVINYTVNMNTTETINVDDACNSYTWNYVDGTETVEVGTYTESDEYTYETTNENGCVHTVTLNLVVNTSTITTDEMVVCDSYTWNAPDNETYVMTESEVKTVEYTNEYGCESSATLNLTVNVNEGTTETVTACDSYEWQYMDAPLTESNTYSVDYTDGNNCNGAHVLNLTVNASTEGNTNVIRNEASTYYNGNYYAGQNYQGDDPDQPYTFDVLFENGNAKGCDSIDHVTLYVTRGIVTDENYNRCGNFTWERNNHTYAWIDTPERQANGNALYKDITDPDNPVYIHTGENPIIMEFDDMGVATHTYVLWLNMIEANYFTYDLGTILLSQQSSITVNPGDTLDNQTIDLSEYIAAKQNVPDFEIEIEHSSEYYCHNYVTYTANLVWNYNTIETNLCDVTSYTWTDANVTFDVPGQYTYVFDEGTENEQVTTMVVTVTERATSDPQVVTICDSYTWENGDGVTYDATGTYNWNDDENCTLETLQLTINTNAGSTADVEICDSYTWNVPTYVYDANSESYVAGDDITNTYTGAEASGEKTVTFIDANGCEGTATLNLTINVNAGSTANEVVCDSYTWNVPTYVYDAISEGYVADDDITNTYTGAEASGEKTVTFIDANGCEGTATLNLTINTNEGLTEEAAECTSYTWEVATYEQDGTGAWVEADPITNTYDFQGTQVTNTYEGSVETSTPTVDFVDANGCVGTATLNLTLYNPVLFTREQYHLGNGITINGHFYAAAENGVAEYTVVLDTTDEHGCATTVTVSLFVSQTEYVYTNKVDCGSYTWTLAENGNDKTYRVMTAEEAEANPTALYWNDTDNEPVTEEPYHAEGNVIYRLNLTLNAPSVTEIPVSIPMSQLINNGYIYTTVDGDIDCSEVANATENTSVTFDFSKGPHSACDSIVRYTVNVIYNFVTDEPVTLCDATTYEVVANDVRNVTVGDNSLEYILNEGEANEEVHTVAVTVVERTVLTDEVAIICYGESYTWLYNNVVYSESTNTTVTNDATDVCDQQTLDLTVRASSSYTEVATQACASYEWSVNTYVYDETLQQWVADDPIVNTYNEVGTADQTVDFVDANGCDAVATLPLTINPVYTEVAEEVTACDSYTWTVTTYDVVNGEYVEVTVNDVPYTESSDDINVYTYTAKTAAGCDSVITLNLTINNSEQVAESYWFGNGSYRYTGIHTTAQGHMYVPGDYEVTEVVPEATEEGCTITYTITLHVGNNYTHTDAIRECDTTTWVRNGVTYARLSDAERAQYPTALYKDLNEDTMVYYNPVVVEPRENDYADEYMLDLTLDAVSVESREVTFPVSMAVLTYEGETFDYSEAAAEAFAATQNDEEEFEDFEDEQEIHLQAMQYCDSVLNVTINVYNNYVFDSIVNICYGETSYEWEGQTLTVANDPDATNTYYMYKDIDNDDHVHYIKVVQHPIQYVTERRTECDSYEWRDVTYTESTSGVVRNFTDQYGCDSTVTLILTINHTSNTVLGSATEPIVACDGYEWVLANGEHVSPKYSESGVYAMEYTSLEGCPSTDSLYLTINKKSEVDLEVVACDSYDLMNGDDVLGHYELSDTYTHVIENAAGCDSIITLKLTVNSSNETTVDDVAACDSYTWTSLTFNTETGEYEEVELGTFTENANDLSFTVTNQYGCDSVLNMVALTIDHSTGALEVTACDSYLWYGDEPYTESGTYTHTSDVANACGNLVETLNLTINYNTSHGEEVAICNRNMPEEGYEWNDQHLFTSGTYYYQYESEVGNCPSTDTIYFTVGNVRTYNRVYVENCGAFTWDLTGETFTEDTEASTILDQANSVGCDSVIYLYLTVYEQPETTETKTICASELPYTWYGKTFAEAGEDTAHTAYSEHCPTVHNLTLNVNPLIEVNLTDEICLGVNYDNNDFSIDANELTAGIHTFSHTVPSVVTGCDSTTILTLTVNDIITVATKVTECDKYEWTAGNGETYAYTVSGTYITDVYTNEAGCKSVDTLILTINANSGTYYTYQSCDTYTWNDVEYDASGVYTYEYDDNNGCASIDTLNLTISNSVTNKFNVTACDSYTWTASNGDEVDTYTEGGTYVYNYTTTSNCTGIDTLVLTINVNGGQVYTETACDSYTWNDEVYTVSGTYTFDYEDINGCSGTDTLKLTVNTNTNSSEDVTACDSYTWNNEVYTASGDYTFAYNAANGCASVDTLHLTVNVNSNTAYTETACVSYNWNDVTYSQSGTFYHHYDNEAGCASIDTLYLTILKASSTVVEETACDKFTWINDETYTASTNTPSVILTAANGCDSVVTLNLTLNYKVYGTETIEACDSYTWVNDETYTASINTPTVTLTAANGCDSIVTLNLTINTYESEVEYAEMCDSYTWNNVEYTTSGTYTFANSDAKGCSGTDTLYLTINSYEPSVEEATACGSYTWNGNEYETSGVYTDLNSDDNGCSGMDTLYLTINNGVTSSFDAVTCNTYNWNGTEYSVTGVYAQTLTAANGCDSVVTMNLTVSPAAQVNITEAVCGSYTWDDDVYTTSGIYTHTYTATNTGCDSVVNLILTINAPITNTVTATACESYTWVNGETYTASTNTPSITLTAANGCDSIVTLNLTINNSVSSSFDETVCNSYTWNGATYTTSGAYNYTYQAANGCDSVVTLNLTISPAITTTIFRNSCSSYTWEGTTYTTSGVYNHTYTAVSGCDSIVTLTLTIKNPVTSTVTATACDSYSWNGLGYTTTGTYTHTYTAANGCDSIVTLNLTVNNSATSSFSETVCGSYTWNGATYTTSGAYNHTYTTVGGCDSVVTLNLTISPAITTTVNEQACVSYVWNGITYSVSGTYTHTYTAVSGCDSIVTLNLTILPAITNNVSETACDNYTWNGTTYTTSGIYTNTFTSVQGCDSIVNLTLTITNSISNTIAETACDSYTWNGEAITTSGIYTETFTSVNNCDSTVTLNLTINASSTSTDSLTACESYTWIDGETYTASTNTPTMTLTNAAGCDSVVTLKLTVNYKTYGIDEQVACDGFIWIDGNNYTESTTTPVDTITGSNGCDSIVTLHLTINNSVDVHETITVNSTDLPYTWRGETIPGAGDYVFNAYTVHGCDSTVYLHVDVNQIGIDVVSLDDLKVYPNPTRGQVTISADEVVKVEVLDIVGRKVATFENTNTFDLSNLVEGAYTLRITLPEGITVRKIVKK